MKILIVEDDVVVGRSIKDGLEQADHSCSWAQNGNEALDLARQKKYDVIVLDRMLPGIDGLTVVRELRKLSIKTPILILTAVGSVDDRVEGLEAGADDYLVKPFSFAELQARIAAIARRTQPDTSPMIQYHDLTLNLSSRRAFRAGVELDLTPTEFSLLEFLTRHAEKTVTRRMLCEHLWSADWEGVTNVVEVHISRLRGKIDKQFSPPLVHTIRGLGYRLEAR